MGKNTVNKAEWAMKASPNKKESEDAYIINEDLGIYGVLDGATPLVDFEDEYGHNGAYLASHLFKDYFEALKVSDFIHEEISHANDLLKSKMESCGVDVSKKNHLWCTCASIIQANHGKLFYASLGDTMIVAENEKGQTNVLTVDTVKNINHRSRYQREIDRQDEHNIPNENVFQSKQKRICYNRSMANRPNGYSVANGMEEAKFYIQYGMIETAGLKHVLIISDGLVDSGATPDTVYHRVVDEGITSYMDRLTLEEQNRGKKPDDKTGLLLYF